ncbi:MAG: hypothetical protein WD513_03250 [Balneolaceae bacterium]
MPKTVRLFIKAGILYFLTGSLLAFISQIPSINTGALLLPVYWHMIVVGWITQIIMGVSLWMFPRSANQKRRTTDKFTIQCSFWLLNTGLILRFLSEPFIPLFPADHIVKWTVLISSILQISAILLYVIEIWPRVRGKISKN